MYFFQLQGMWMCLTPYFILFFLRKVLEQRDGVYEKIAQYLQLKNTITSIQVLYILLFYSLYSSLQITFKSVTSNTFVYLFQQTGSKELKTDVDLGCNFYVQAHV